MTEHKIWNRILASRDEARLQAHLASIEAKAEFDKLDARIEAFAKKSGRKLEKLGDHIEDKTKLTLKQMQGWCLAD